MVPSLCGGAVLTALAVLLIAVAATVAAWVLPWAEATAAFDTKPPVRPPNTYLDWWQGTSTTVTVRTWIWGATYELTTVHRPRPPIIGVLLAPNASNMSNMSNQSPPTMMPTFSPTSMPTASPTTSLPAPVRATRYYGEQFSVAMHVDPLLKAVLGRSGVFTLPVPSGKLQACRWLHVLTVLFSLATMGVIVCVRAPKKRSGPHAGRRGSCMCRRVTALEHRLAWRLLARPELMWMLRAALLLNAAFGVFAWALAYDELVPGAAAQVKAICASLDYTCVRGPLSHLRLGFAAGGAAAAAAVLGALLFLLHRNNQGPQWATRVEYEL